MEMEIRRGYSSAKDAVTAARELHTAIWQPDLELVLFFCSIDYNLDRLGAELNRAFPGVTLIGCTTTGQIGPQGRRELGLAGVGFVRGICTAVAGHVDHLETFEAADGHSLANRVLYELEHKSGPGGQGNTFGLLLVDGLSMREEVVARAVHEALGEVPLVGGSASDGEQLKKTWVFADGSFRTGSAVLAVISTPLPVMVFKTQHLEPTEKRLVITAADPARRLVQEINGLPAAAEYARHLGLHKDQLTAGVFAASPLVVMIGGTYYVRSIQCVNPDGSLTFFCAVEEGVVLRMARSCELVRSLEQTFAGIRERIGPPQLVLAFDCGLRWAEIEQSYLVRPVDQLYRANNTIGFNTYGEIFQGVHINQTLTGIAIGAGPGEARHA